MSSILSPRVLLEPMETNKLSILNTIYWLIIFYIISIVPRLNVGLSRGLGFIFLAGFMEGCLLAWFINKKPEIFLQVTRGIKVPKSALDKDKDIRDSETVATLLCSAPSVIIWFEYVFLIIVNLITKDHPSGPAWFIVLYIWRLMLPLWMHSAIEIFSKGIYRSIDWEAVADEVVE